MGKVQEFIRKILSIINEKLAATKFSGSPTTENPLKLLIKRGGLKLKLIGFATLVILTTVVLVSTIIVQLMKSSIESKAFEVATTSIERLGDFSIHALLERSYENRLNLNEMVKDIQASNIEGVLDIAIYERVKGEKSIDFKYMAGFHQEHEGTNLDDAQTVATLNDNIAETVTYKEVTITTADGEIEAFRFVRPILYTFQKRTILLGVAVLDYDQEAINGIIKKVIRIAMLVTVLVLAATMVLVYFAGLSFTRPILTIAQAATDVSQGNLNIDLDIKTHDEIGELASRFNQMVTGLREREKMQKFVSGSTIDMIKGDSKAQLVLGGEYRAMTFLFTDVRGFTAMSESKKPDEVVTIINFYLNLQSEIIKAHGGDIDKFVGDEIMASFSGDDGVDSAMKAAVEIQRTIAKENKKRAKAGLTVCEVGIGINYGEVIVGNIGSNDRMDFTSMGATVNLAARLCSAATPSQVLVEKTTCERAKESFDIVEQTPIQAKGIAQPVAVYEIVTKE